MQGLKQWTRQQNATKLIGSSPHYKAQGTKFSIHFNFLLSYVTQFPLLEKSIQSRLKFPYASYFKPITLTTRLKGNRFNRRNAFTYLQLIKTITPYKQNPFCTISNPQIYTKTFNGIGAETCQLLFSSRTVRMTSS